MTEMREVSHEEFFQAMNDKDVHPHLTGAWSNETGYTSEWKLRGGRTIIGKSQGPIKRIHPTRYWLP